MNKKYIWIIFILLLFAGLAAVTQEADIFLSSPAVEARDSKDSNGGFEETPPARWFRSNSAGMALEEIPSRHTALRNEYALGVDFAYKEELPENLLPFYNDGYLIEIRTLYKNGEQSRTQWVFTDINRTTRLNAVFEEPSESDGDDNDKNIQRAGFIDIFDEKSFLLTEYRFFENGDKHRTDFNFNDGLLLSTVVLLWEENEGEGEYKEYYADFFRYNRSSFLRSMERIFYKDGQLSLQNEPLMVSFPNRIMDAAKDGFFISERPNPYPDFFAASSVDSESLIVYSIDERGRVLSQILYDGKENVIWEIYNTWANDRIVSMLKIEGETKFLAEYEYNSDGERIIERNFRNGILERLVSTEGNIDIEELYLNNVLVLRSVWEDGRKISETRFGSR